MTTELNNGISIPQVGFGCWKLARETAAQQIYDAIEAGYRLFDGAMDYGNEKEVGEGIAKAIEAGLCTRDELTVVSKLWNNFHHPKSVSLAIDKILGDLGLDYLDVLYIHFPIAQKFVPFEKKYPPNFYCGESGWQFEDVPLLDTWRAMENLVSIGKVKSIGVSNFSGALLQDLLRGAKIRPQLLQIEHHPYLVQERLIEYVQSENIVVTGYSSFGPQSFVELDHPKVKQVQPLFEHPVILAIAEKHQVSASKVLLRWNTQRGVCVIPKSNQKARLLQNLAINDFTLDDKDLKAISGLDVGLRFNDPWDWAKIPTFI